MKQITARQFMVTELVTFDPGADVFEAMAQLVSHRISGAPVVESDGRYLGVFSERCAMQVLLDAAYDELPVREVRAYMDVDAQTIGPDTHLLSVAQVFLLTPYRRLPVLVDGKLVGEVSRRDVVQCSLDLLERLPARTPEMTLVHFSAMFAEHEAPLA